MDLLSYTANIVKFSMASERALQSFHLCYQGFSCGSMHDYLNLYLKATTREVRVSRDWLTLKAARSLCASGWL